jgi:hypothetical protein
MGATDDRAPAPKRPDFIGGQLMRNRNVVRPRNRGPLAVAIGVTLASSAGSAHALDFEFDNGVTVNWNTTLSVGSSWRAEDPSRELYTKAGGSLIGLTSGPTLPPVPPNALIGPNDGLAGNGAESGTLNYDKGDRFSTPFKLVSDIEIRKGNFGGLVRFKAWYDQALNENDVRLGNQANNYNGVRPGLGPQPGGTFIPPLDGNWPRQPLSDVAFEDEQKFDNAMLLDAYLYGTFEVGNSDLQLRLGRQVVNWGESVFIQGINQINPIDVPAARRPGTELKEVLQPVGMAYLNWGFGFGSVEAFYQFEWQNTSIDSCGTYWAVTEGIISSRAGQCNAATHITQVYGSALPNGVIVPQLGSNVFAQANGLYVPLVNGKDASDTGQFGLAIRIPVDAISTEFGIYGMNIHSRLPMISGISGTNPDEIPEPYRTILIQQGVVGFDTGPGGIQLPFWRLTPTATIRNPAPVHAALIAQATGGAVQVNPGRSYWEYPEDIQIYGLTAATNLFGWSVSAEASHQIDVPVQVNGNDLLQSLLTFLGPNGEEGVAAALQGDGGYLRGYDLFDKTQFQVNTVKTFSNIIGAENLVFIGEVGFQWNDVPDFQDSVRYGRGFMFGVGSNPFTDAQLAARGVTTEDGTCSLAATAFGVATILNPTYNPAPNGCKNDGYVTDHSWGYRLRVSADYNNVFDSGVTVTPSVFWAHDVDGVSMDPTFIEDRQTLGLGLRFNYNKKYTLEFNYVDYAAADFDPLQDRDYYSVSASVTF